MIDNEYQDEAANVRRESALLALASSRLPLMVWVAIVTTVIAFAYAGSAFAFFSVGGFAWVIALAFAAMITVARANRITFPVGIWLPWVCVVVAYGITSDYANVQRSTMLICPFVVGIASSTARIDESRAAVFILLMKVTLLVLISIIVVLTGLLITGVLPAATAFAPQAIATLLFSAIFISSYSYGNIRDIFWYIGAACVPIIALTRGPMIVTGLSLPFSFAPIKIQMRMILMGIIVLVGIALFFSPRVQKKFFYSGEGTIEDLQDERKVSTSGRRRMAELLVVEIARKPLLGHGANASESFILNYSNGQLTHPHNDWLRFLYDYGIVGTSIFALTLLVQIRNLLRRAKKGGETTKILYSAGASSFLSFALMMFTDNIVLYAAYFGNLQFAMIGLAYAAERNTIRDETTEEGTDKEPADGIITGRKYQTRRHRYESRE
jgi:O-antigen ligase